MQNRLLKSTLIVSAMTGISRIFGLLRDVVIGVLFGPGAGVDAFIVAFRIPNFLRRLFAEGGFSQAFVPVLSEYREKRDKAEVKALIDQTTLTLGLVLCLITLLGVLAAPALIWLFAPGFASEPGRQLMATDMLRITFPYILFISLTALAGGILNTYRNFAVPAFTPVLLNLSLIACAVFLSPRFAEPVYALAWGVLLAGMAQLLFQLPFLKRLGLLPRPAPKRDREGLRRIIRLMIPTLFAASITQINLLIDTLIASFLQTGSISWLYFSDRLVEFPLGVFGIALSTVILPSLAAQYASAAGSAWHQTLDWALRLVFLLALPAAAGLAMLAAPMLATLFQYEAFTRHDVLMASHSLIAYALGLPAFILIKVLSAGFFSRQDTKTPVKIAAVAMFANLVLNLLLVQYLAHAGLALATSLAASLNAGLLYLSLRNRDHYRAGGGWWVYLGKMLLSLAAMCLLLLWLSPAMTAWFSWGLYERAANLALCILAGAGVYFLVLRLVGIGLRQMTAPPPAL